MDAQVTSDPLSPWPEITLQGDPILLIGWRVPGRRFEAAKVDTAGPVQTALREICSRTLGLLRSQLPRHYEPTAALEQEDEFFQIATEDLLRPQQRRGRAHDAADSPAVVDDRAEIAALVELAARPTVSIPTTGAREIQSGRPFAFYAIATVDTESRPWLFVKRGGGRPPLRAGHLWMSLDRETLNRIEPPALILEDTVDLLIGRDKLAVLNAAAFEALFADVKLVQASAPRWTAELCEVVPLTETARDAVQARCSRAASRARRLRNILPSLVASFDTAGFLRAARQEGYPGRFRRQHGSLEFDGDDVDLFLDLLEDRMYTGPITRTRRRADRYSTR
jgi:hypothetical protein